MLINDRWIAYIMWYVIVLVCGNGSGFIGDMMYNGRVSTCDWGTNNIEHKLYEFMSYMRNHLPIMLWFCQTALREPCENQIQSTEKRKVEIVLLDIKIILIYFILFLFEIEILFESIINSDCYTNLVCYDLDKLNNIPLSIPFAFN